MTLFNEEEFGGVARINLADAKDCLCNGNYKLSVEYCGNALKAIFKEYISTMDKEYFLNSRVFSNEGLLDLFKAVSKYAKAELPDNMGSSNIVRLSNMLIGETELKDKEEAFRIYEYSNYTFKCLTGVLVSLELGKRDVKRNPIDSLREESVK